MGNKEPDFKYYNLPDSVQRVNLGPEIPHPARSKIEFEQKSGQLSVEFYPNKLPQTIASDQEKTWILIADGMGTVNYGSQTHEINNVPAVFYLEEDQETLVDGNFSAWIIKLKEASPTPNLPTGPNSITFKVFSPEELKGEIDPSVANIFGQVKGEIIRWVMGQWNSKSPINIAFEGGGLGSIGNRMHKEPQIAEIHLVNQGRRVLSCVDDEGNHFKFPCRKGDAVNIKPGTFCQMSRYSGDYKGFTIKWACQQGKIIDPKAKIYFEASKAN